MAKVKLLDPSDKSRQLDRYELIGELASGGMATVFLARLAGVGGFQRFVAIKRLHPHLAGEQEFIEMFLDEARLAARIHHPHVVPILEVGQSESGYYLVMEYIEGDTLARVVARSLSIAKPVPRATLLRIMLDALAGLHAAHELTDDLGTLLNLVHRDCSPQNILVGVDGCSRITDFGVARASSRLSTTRTDRLKGKLAYMAPEQAKGEDVDRRSDVFAMGIILWEILASKRLFKADTEAATLTRVVLKPIPQLSSVIPSMPRVLDEVCMRALDRDPDKRFQSAGEMADAIEAAAREIAASSPTEIGIASPREVAGYVQGMLGQDIAAQRESVRSWLTHSEVSLPRISVVKAGYDVTFKMPIEGQRLTPAPPEKKDTVTEGHRESGRPPANEAGAGADDENETLLMESKHEALLPPAPGMQPVAPSAPAPARARAAPAYTADEGTPIASTGTALISVAPPPRRRPFIALAAGAVLAIGAFALWTLLRSGSSGTGTQPAQGVTSPATSTAAATTIAPPASAPATASADTGPEPTATQKTAPTQPRGRGGPARPAGPAAPVGKPADQAKPPEAAKPPGGEEVVNPYR